MNIQGLPIVAVAHSLCNQFTQHLVSTFNFQPNKFQNLDNVDALLKLRIFGLLFYHDHHDHHIHHHHYSLIIITIIIVIMKVLNLLICPFSFVTVCHTDVPKEP